MKTTMAVFTAMTMIAMVLAPVGSAEEFRGADCSNPPNPATQQCKTAFGPLGVVDKDFGGVGLFACSDDSDPSDPTQALPIGCSVAGGGGANFWVNASAPPAFTPWAGTNVLARVWVEWIGGGLTMPDDNMEGFRVTFCSDRNDNNVCTNSKLTEDDDYVTVQSDGNKFLTTDPALKCKEEKGTKKECDNVEAEAFLCVRPDYDENPLTGVRTLTDYDDVTVFVGAITHVSGIQDFEDPSYGGSQFHASSGFFEIWLETVADPSTCEP